MEVESIMVGLTILGSREIAYEISGRCTMLLENGNCRA